MDEDLLFDAMPTILAYLWAIAAGVSVAFQVGGVRSPALELLLQLRPLPAGAHFIRLRLGAFEIVLVCEFSGKQCYGAVGFLRSEQREFFYCSRTVHWTRRSP